MRRRCARVDYREPSDHWVVLALCLCDEVREGHGATWPNGIAHRSEASTSLERDPLGLGSVTGAAKRPTWAAPVDIFARRR